MGEKVYFHGTRRVARDAVKTLLATVRHADTDVVVTDDGVFVHVVSNDRRAEGIMAKLYDQSEKWLPWNLNIFWAQDHVNEIYVGRKGCARFRGYGGPGSGAA